MKIKIQMFNPFYRSKAEGFTDEDVRDLFIPNRIWDKIRAPMNQIVCGAPGSGKSFVLKRLSTQSLLYDEDSLKDLRYIGVYLPLSKIAQNFSSLFLHLDKKRGSPIEDIEEEDKKGYLQKRYFQRLFGHSLFLRIMNQLISDSMALFQKKGVPADYSSSIRTQVYELSLLNKIINEDRKTLEDVSYILAKEEGEIGEYLSSWTGFEERLFKFREFDLYSSLDKGVRDLMKIYNLLFNKKVEIYLLLDVSYGIRVECEEIVNILLQRGYSYRTKLAVRPYDWKTLDVFEGRTLEINNDFYILSIEYPEEDRENYRELMRAILDRLIKDAIEKKREGWTGLPENTTISNILGERRDGSYCGFEDLFEVSSENPYQSILISSKIFEDALRSDLNPVEGIPPEIQNRSIKEYSRTTLLNIGDERLGILRKLLRNLSDINGSSIEIVEGIKEGFLEDKDYIVPFFTRGLFRFKKETDVTNLKQIPSSFNINKVFFPQGDLDLKGDRILPVSLDFFKKGPFFGKREPLISKKMPQLKRVFLSSSFKDVPYTNLQRESIKEVLRRDGIECSDLEDLPKEQFLLSTILRYIKNTDATLFDLTELRPNVILELGVCAGLKRSVICLFNKDSGGKIEDKLPEYIRSLSIIPYSFKEDDLIKMVKEVRENFCHMSRGRPWEEGAGRPLRKRQEPNTIYLSYPKQRKIRERVYPMVCDKLGAMGYSVINEDNAPRSANSLQRPIFCISISKYVVIDTTGLDLLQCYKLGLSLSLKRVGIRIEEEGEDRQSGLLWQEEYSTWRDVDGLIRIILETIKEGAGAKYK